ncbi:hypothetical protein EXN66_Car016443 [Channa argus]|uniref:Uncharacterized protein n=1 Tax=Channa argus TaxID=215402 RepID=A0A6G1QDX5_CHAAH|nr:hypothetical protein EXN66_Car016443 [Channa argus]
MISLQANIEFVEKELEFARVQAEKLEEQYVSANREFEEGLKGRALSPSGSSSQATGPCSQNVPPEKWHLVGEMRNRLAHRRKLLAQLENLQGQRDEKTIHHLQTHRKLLHILIQCERHKKEQVKNLCEDNMTESQRFIQSLYHIMGESMEPIKSSFDLSLHELNLLARRKTVSKCWRNRFDMRKSSAETQKTVSDLLSKLEMLDTVLERERLKTEKYKQRYQSLMQEYEKVSEWIKQRTSSCTCGPSVTPDLHTAECKISFTSDYEDLLDGLDECVGDIMDNVAEVEKQAEDRVEVFTRAVRQEAATNQWDCMWICSPGTRFEEDPDNRLRSKLKSLEAQLKYERDRAEKFEQLHLIVGRQFEDWTKVENQLVESQNWSKEQTRAVGLKRGQRDKVKLPSSNKPLLAESPTMFTMTGNFTEEVDLSEEETDERTSDTTAAEPRQQETKSTSGWFSSKIVKGVYVAAAVGVGVLVARLLYQ